MLSRRAFVQVAAGAGAGLTLAFYLPGKLSVPRRKSPQPFGAQGWIRIEESGAVIFSTDRSELGQGILTAFAMLLADELEADWASVSVAPVVNDPAGWSRPLVTAASRSIRQSYDMLRTAGAAAREMLVAAAAEQWGVEPAACRAEQGFVIETETGRRASYGSLAARAATLEVPSAPRLKHPSEHRLIGRPVKRLDTPAKVTGAAVYGIDVRVPGMLYASVERSPVFGGTLVSLDDTAAKAMPGVRDVVRLPAIGTNKPAPWTWRTYTESAVGVVAESYWQAVKARRALELEWDDGPAGSLDSDEIRAGFAERAERPGVVARQEGRADQELARAATTVRAVYDVPFLHHATMEPMNCTADVRADGCDVWVPAQRQSDAQQVAASVAGLPLDRVRIHTTFVGGGFGRRQDNDFVAEAVALSKAVGRPVQLIWSREDDMHHGFYRPMVHNRLAAGLDDEGRIVAWTHRIVGPSIMKWKYGTLKKGRDGWLTEKAADLHYRIPNIRVDHIIADLPVPVGFWRSTGASHNSYVTECFFDEVAAAARRDPYELRRELLRHQPRAQAVLDLAADRAGWGRALPGGRARGIAIVEYAQSTVAKVAEVSVDDQGVPRVHRVVCAIDCGPAVNPDSIAAQIEGGVAFGLSAALYGEIHIARGRVSQSNFHDYRVLRMHEMPAVETHILESSHPVGAVGDPALPVVAPAVCNAIFAATGRPVRRLPILGSGSAARA